MTSGMNISFRSGQYPPYQSSRIQVSAFLTQSDDTAKTDTGIQYEELFLLMSQIAMREILLAV